MVWSEAPSCGAADRAQTRRSTARSTAASFGCAAANAPADTRHPPKMNQCPLKRDSPSIKKDISSEPTINFQGFGKNTLLRKGRSLVTEHNCSTEGRKFAKATLAYSSAVFNSTPISNSIDWNLLKLLIQSRPNTKCSYKVAQIRICNTNQELEPLESS